MDEKYVFTSNLSLLLRRKDTLHSTKVHHHEALRLQKLIISHLPGLFESFMRLFLLFQQAANWRKWHFRYLHRLLVLLSDSLGIFKGLITVTVQNTMCKPCFSNSAFVQFQHNFCIIGILSVSVSCVLS